MTSPFITAAFLWWWRIIPAACAGTGLAWGIRWWIRQWRQAASLIAETAAMGDAPVAYWPAEDVQLDGIEALMATVTCTWCKPAGTGLCSCSGRCGHIRCIGRGSTWTAADVEILKGKRLP